jgi:hypothetical protein
MSPSWQALRRWLSANAFREVDDAAATARYEATRTLSDTRRVDISFDGGAWSLSLGVSGMANTYHPDEWEAWLDRQPLKWRLSEVEHQVDFIVHRWMHAVELALADVAVAEAEMKAIGLEWVERRFGWRPGA